MKKCPWREAGLCLVFFQRGAKGPMSSLVLMRGRQRVPRAMTSCLLTLAHTSTAYPTPAFLTRKRNLMICFCGRPRRAWGHLPVCFFSGTTVGSAQKGVLLGYSISCICCFKNTSAPAREGHVLLVGTWPQTWCFLCLGESLRFNGCFIQRMMGI